MQGLVSFASDVGVGLSVVLPTFCYLASLYCFGYAGWTFWTMAADGVGGGPSPHRNRPWVPWVSLILCGVFAAFPSFLTQLNVSLHTDLVASLTSYAPTPPPAVAAIGGLTPFETMVNVVRAFERFFQAFGAMCVFFAILRWRAMLNGRVDGSMLGCAVQILFGAMLINVVTVSEGLVELFV